MGGAVWLSCLPATPEPAPVLIPAPPALLSFEFPDLLVNMLYFNQVLVHSKGASAAGVRRGTHAVAICTCLLSALSNVWGDGRGWRQPP
jgi:hypothetical protein